MTRYRIAPYKMGSASARALADALGGLRLKVRGSRFRPRDSDVLINWGSSMQHPNLVGARVLNPFDRIENVADKLRFFEMLAGFDVTPDYWTAGDEIPEDAFPIVCRTVLNGHSGQGIVIANTREELVYAPLYTRYIKKDQEYRVHLGWKAGDLVTISRQRKARRRDVPDAEVNWQIRNHDNGFIFARGDVSLPESVVESARVAFGATGLDFGAADVALGRDGRAYVLEINSAPGITGTTVTEYADFFRREG